MEMWVMQRWQREGGRGDSWLVVESEHCRLLEEGAAAAAAAAAEDDHKLSLYLGHWDAPAAASRQDAIMQEEGCWESWARALIVPVSEHMSGGCMVMEHETS
ncbi:unnamed protein product [Pleuronectes platessa]|uniref:Uncharacterized protein n=1 Tax=Pleuronectes platessa TaxID=8262 RepID=A0A9N7UC90_PLEPL|nr:unnamed protein product [Pleuronectes platessa]